MNYYIDTEFLEGPQKEKFPISLFRKNTPPTIDLISIGIIAEDEREYYAISKDFNLEEAWNRHQYNLDYFDAKEYWLRENVLKPIWIDLFLNYEAEFTFLKGKSYDAFEKELKNGEHDKLFTFKSFKTLVNRYGKTNKQIAEEVNSFTKQYSNKDTEVWDIPKFYAYYADYDWVAFCWLFGKMMDLPDGFPMYCNDLKQCFDELDIKSQMNGLKNLHNYPKQENEHNALEDACWNKKLHEFLNNL